MLRLVDEAVENYCLNHSTPETNIYEELRKETYQSMEIPTDACRDSWWVVFCK